MSNVKIVTDTLADIPADITRDLGITVVPTIVRFRKREYCDGIDLFPNKFYQPLTASRELPNASQPSPGILQAIYDCLTHTTDEIFATHTVASLSRIFTSAWTASHNIKRAYSDHRFETSPHQDLAQLESRGSPRLGLLLHVKMGYAL